MADRFPSLDEFDAGQTEPTAAPAADEPSDFLARERAALGEDAEQFADEGDNDLLGGGMDTSASAPAPEAATNGTDGDMMGDFEQSFPAVDTSNEAVAPGGTITGSTLPYHPPTAGTSNYAQPSFGGEEDDVEPEPIREWREKRDAQIAKRDEISSNKKAETVKAAQEAIDEFYENYNNRRDKQVAQTKREAEEFLNKREDTTSGGTTWERISKIVDLSGKGAAGGAAGTGKHRMREMLVGLRKDENAPGAKGY